MRQIKFRAKRKDNGEWVYGDLETKPVHHECAIRENGVIVYGVDPETVGQYTGLDDKNSRPIYEGDIVEGFKGWPRGAGYKREGFPDKIRVRLQVVYGDGKGWDVGWRLLAVGVHPEDKRASEIYFYRRIDYNLRESWKMNCGEDCSDKPVIYSGCNNDLEVIGNIRDNPELINNDRKIA